MSIDSGSLAERQRVVSISIPGQQRLSRSDRPDAEVAAAHILRT